MLYPINYNRYFPNTQRGVRIHNIVLCFNSNKLRSIVGQLYNLFITNRTLHVPSIINDILPLQSSDYNYTIRLVDLYSFYDDQNYPFLSMYSCFMFTFQCVILSWYCIENKHFTFSKFQPDIHIEVLSATVIILMSYLLTV